MSGGSLDYACYKVTQIAEDVKRKSQTPLHRAFSKHLENISKALHDLEWVLSGDLSDGDEVESIKSILSPSCVLEQVTEEAQIAFDNLKMELDKLDK